MNRNRRRFVKQAFSTVVGAVSCKTVFAGPLLPPGVLWRANHETGDLTRWYSPSTGPFANYGGGIYISGLGSCRASKDTAHSGSYSAKCTITTPHSPTSGVRLFRWAESHAYRRLYFSAWFFFPVQYRLTQDPATGRFWDLFQFKSRSKGGRNDPIWAFYTQSDGKGGLKIRAGWGWGGTTVSGPFASDGVGGKFFSESIVSIPVGRWVYFEALLKQSNAFDGTLIFWQDGIQLFNFQNIRTSYANPNFNSWNCSNEWSVNSYSDGLVPNPATIYIDDAVISTTRFGS